MAGRMLARGRTSLRALRRRGDAVTCPCCGASFAGYLPSGGRPNTACPGCGARERHRAIAPFLRATIEPGMRVLHFAPEPWITHILLSLGIEYTAADLYPDGRYISRGVEVVRADISDQPFTDAAFDVAIVSHVLEHVVDDERAARELHRVLVPGGHLIAQHPYDPERDRTFSDPSVTDPAERLRLFNQEDHVRIYGRDVFALFERVGFAVTVIADDPSPGSHIADCVKPR
jgi:SAM-dependent methyltransferase